MEEHLQQLNNDNEERMAAAGLDTSQVDKSDKIKVFEQNVTKHINLLDQDLRQIKKENTMRFKVRPFWFKFSYKNSRRATFSRTTSSPSRIRQVL